MPVPEHQARPVTLLGASLVEGAEAVVVAVASLFAGISAAEGKAYQNSSGIAITAIGFGTVVLLAFVAFGLARSSRWSRTPALMTQLFTGITGVLLVQAGRYWWGVPAVVLAVAGFVLLLVPRSFRALTYGADGSADDR